MLTGMGKPAPRGDAVDLVLDTLPGNDIVTGAFDRLVESKRRRYATDDRAAGNWALRLEGDGSVALWAEARR